MYDTNGSSHIQDHHALRTGGPGLSAPRSVILNPASMPPFTQPVAITESAILAALRDCYDPVFGLNIVDLGLVEAISIAPDPDAPGSGIPGVPPRSRVTVAIIHATSAATEESTLPAIIQNRLAAFETISRSEVEIRTDPLWTTGRISPEGRSRLAAHLNSRKPADALVQINAQFKT
jgi:metal-sulfur cluster biosynthetic enzyme